MVTNTDRYGRRSEIGRWISDGRNTITHVQLKWLDDDEIESLHGSLGSLVRREIPIQLDGGVARPKRREGASELSTRYRENVAAYIKARTGVEVPVSSTAPCSIYNAIADLVERLVEE